MYSAAATGAQSRRLFPTPGNPCQVDTACAMRLSLNPLLLLLGWGGHLTHGIQIAYLDGKTVRGRNSIGDRITPMGDCSLAAR